MAVVDTIYNGYQLQRLFEQCDRGNHFSYEGYDALFEYLDNFSDETGEDFKVDVIALCCDFTEYESWEEIYDNYSYSYNNEEETWEETDQDNFIEWVYDNTTVIECYNYKKDLVGVILQCF